MGEKIQMTPATGAVMIYGAWCELCGVHRDFGIDKDKAEFRISLHNRIDHGEEPKDG